jgi:hypothetical protein
VPSGLNHEPKFAHRTSVSWPAGPGIGNSQVRALEIGRCVRRRAHVILIGAIDHHNAITAQADGLAVDVAFWWTIALAVPTLRRLSERPERPCFETPPVGALFSRRRRLSNVIDGSGGLMVLPLCWAGDGYVGLDDGELASRVGAVKAGTEAEELLPSGARVSLGRGIAASPPLTDDCVRTPDDAECPRADFLVASWAHGHRVEGGTASVFEDHGLCVGVAVAISPFF